jgi:hypothetical protein
MELFIILAGIIGLAGGYTGAVASTKKKMGSAAEKAEKNS